MNCQLKSLENLLLSEIIELIQPVLLNYKLFYLYKLITFAL